MKIETSFLFMRPKGLVEYSLMYVHARPENQEISDIYLRLRLHGIINSYMFRSVWDQIHCGMETICLHMTGSNLNSIVLYGITFISGPIWYQRADLIHTGSTWSHANIRLTNINFILGPKGSSPCKCCLNLWPSWILATLNSRAFSLPFRYFR